MPEAGDRVPDPAADPLAALLLLQGALHAAPDQRRLAEMLAHGLVPVPGVAGLRVCLAGRTVAASGAASTTRHFFGDEPCRCATADPEVVRTMPLAGASGIFGHLSILIADPAALAPYAALVESIASTAAVRLESDKAKQALAALNFRLEEEVRARTAQLRATIANLELAVDATGGLLWTWDLVKDELSASNPNEEWIGWPRDRPVSASYFFGRLSPRDQGVLNAAVTQAIATHEILVVEIRSAVERGPERLLSMRGRVGFDAAGRPIRVSGIVTDITERRRAEEVEAEQRRLRELERDEAAARLAESERRYRLLADNASDVIWLLDFGSLRFTYISPSITRLRGLTVEEAMAESVADSLTPESWARVRAVMASMGTPEEEDPHVGVYDQYCKDGSIRHVEMTTSYVRDSDGRPLAAIGVSRDATQRVRAEQALRDSEARFRAIIERSTDLTVLVDMAGVIQFASPSFADFVGWTGAEVLGKQLRRFIHPDDLAATQEAFAETITGATVHGRFRFAHRDGRWHRVDGWSRSLLDDPAVGGIVVNGHDVTEQIELEEQLRQAQKLESVGRLAGGIAHDFNNLLTVILSYAEALTEDVAAGLMPQIEDVAAIRAAGRRASDLTRQLLTFARKTVIAPVVVDLNALIGGTERLLRRVISEDIELEVVPGPDLWPVLVDPGQVEQVLVNLAVNARDAMPFGGTLTVATENVRVAEDPLVVHAGGAPGDYVRVTVRDTGIGMSDEVRAHLFEPFFTTKAPGKGTGLGLATVHGIVTRSGGHIHVSSALGLGATFEVMLPRTEGAVARDSDGARTAAAGGSEVVLVVEDDEAVRGVTVRSLEQAGYHVLVADSAQAALSLPRDEVARVALLVTDVVMPGLDGHALAIRLSRRNPEMRTLFVSGYTDDTITERGVLPEGIEFLSKPFTPALLQARARSILDGRRRGPS